MADLPTCEHDETPSRAGVPRVQDVLSKFRTASRWRAAWQLTNSIGPYVLLWYAMYRVLAVSYWLALPLAILAAGFLVRIFIIFHDCGHASFFKSRRGNHATGVIVGMFTLTPYFHWRWQHALHHGTSGDLDSRGSGDIWTLTVQEYLESSRWRRFAYRLARNPIVLFVIAPLYLFMIDHRIPSPKAPKRERRSVYLTNLAILGLTILLSALMGIKAYLLIQLTVSTIAGAAGVWLFYVQHQFEGGYWERGDDWDYTAAALQGSSFYKLPRILQWFTGNIGFHHVHHLSPGIPNYHLQSCHDAEPLFQRVKTLTLCSSWRSLTLRLWDERRKEFVGYRHLRRAS
jgi:omega-6 fatty acid desaturase (delta-12 desaturase)